MKKKELLFIIGILFLALLLWGGLNLFGSHHYGTVKIERDGTLYGTYSLSEDQIITIGTTNICEIKDGSIRMTDASCPDHLCVQQGAIDSRGGMIVCLPNKVVIEAVYTGVSEDIPEIDAVS